MKPGEPKKKSIADEAQQIFKASALIRMGARMQVLESEFTLSRDRLIRLYREVKGASPPKGMLPFSEDWYLTWGPNIHASFFANVYLFLRANSELSRLDLLSKGYALYLEHFEMIGQEPLMDLTRAWTLVRFFDAGILKVAPCKQCHGKFVAHAQDLGRITACGICVPPARAGRTKAAKQLETARLAQAELDFGRDSRETSAPLESPESADASSTPQAVSGQKTDDSAAADQVAIDATRAASSDTAVISGITMAPEASATASSAARPARVSFNAFGFGQGSPLPV